MSTSSEKLNLHLSDRKEGRDPIVWDSMTIKREGGLQLAESESQTPSLKSVDKHRNRHAESDSPETLDSAMGHHGTRRGVPTSHCGLEPSNPPSARSGYITTSRSVTIIRRNHREMTKEEIIRAKDAMILAQQRRIERMRQKIRDLKDQLYAADRVQALTMDILDLSLELDMEIVL
ncbi:hypothetical protein BKA70DRAFT_1438768 [Coprinopsis sp. MPI-PUGE-AT-0042]|nr:hypothetical protein BKA70DRAFT_1438768 [Coprinopsis sp. MPI-PUGE-AT-0042]